MSDTLLDNSGIFLTEDGEVRSLQEIDLRTGGEDAIENSGSEEGRLIATVQEAVFKVKNRLQIRCRDCSRKKIS